jgi:hypothetical protein
MDKHEMKARIDAQSAEWKTNLDTMRAKADAATGDAKVGYQERVAGLQKQFDELKIQAARSWDVADDKWDSASKDLELKWDEWQLRAKSAWHEFTK